MKIMTLIPEFEIGLWNAWILCIIFMVSNYLLLFAPKAKQNFKEMMDQVKQAKDKNKLIVNGCTTNFHNLDKLCKFIIELNELNELNEF